MFTSFSLTPEGEGRDENLAPSKPRIKRHQVNRACVWCRTYRIKCDAQYPCGNCKAKGRKCTAEEGKEQVRTFPSAIKEIDRLRERVRELEDQLNGLQVKQQPSFGHMSDDETLYIKQEDALPEELDPLSQHGGNKNYYNWDFATREIKPGSNQTYGSSSTFYFISQISSYLDAALQQLTCSLSESSPGPPTSTVRTLFGALTGRDSVSLDRSVVQQDLPRPDEQRLLDLYWCSWHVLYPILNKEAFRAYYDSLWEASNLSRDPSALVDILLALCMQYNAALVSSHTKPHTRSSSGPTDSTAGWWFYRRCQYFLQDDMEDPSITTFQCHFLAVIWLSRASWQNAAHSVLAAGLRIGIILGLHVEPCSDLPPSLREYRKRLWWTMYTIDAQYAMELGRPLGVHFGQVTCSLPKDDATLKDHVPGMLRPASFNTQLIKLILATRAIYIMFYRVCARVLRQSGETNLYHDLKNLEVCAEWLETNISYLRAWERQVPEALKTPRENAGKPYSTDQSRLRSSVDAASRGRLILEIIYHQMAMSLYRSFITFRQRNGKEALATERHAISCVNHAITITNIIHQDITESDSLRSWQMTCSWQWNAALSLVGYVLTYPRGLVTPTARKTLSTALTSFDILSHTFTNAISANEVLRDLLSKVDILLQDGRLSIGGIWGQKHPQLSTNTASKPDTDGTQGLSSEWNDHFAQGAMASWTSPEFNLPEFSSSADSMISEEWVFSLLDFGPEEH